MSERTARKYERAGKLPSQMKRPHTWRTRPNPCEEDWPWVIEHLERDPVLQGTTLFALVCARHPGRYRPTQVRTLQRHIAAWRALHGPEREVIFAQEHTPGERGQSDFTWMNDMAITIAGEPFPHRLFHFSSPTPLWRRFRFVRVSASKRWPKGWNVPSGSWAGYLPNTGPII